MKFLWHVLGITEVDLEIQQFQQEWLQHLQRMGTKGINLKGGEI